MATSTFTLNDRYGIYGSRGTYGIGLAPVARFGRDGRRGCCCGRYGTLGFTQQMWYLVILTFILWGRYDTYGIGLGLVACVGRSGRGGRGGRRGCWRDNLTHTAVGMVGVVGVAGMELGNIYFRFT